MTCPAARPPRLTLPRHRARPEASFAPSPTAARAALARRGDDAGLDGVLALDERRRALLPEIEGLRAEQNEANQAIAAPSGRGGADEAIARMRDVAARAKALERGAGDGRGRAQDALAALPNLPEPDAPPDGHGRPRGRRARRMPVDPPRDHLELAGAAIDMERGARLSGSRFAYLSGDLVMLELALVR